MLHLRTFTANRSDSERSTSLSIRDGSAVVVDCRLADRRPARDLAKFEATRRACELVGWEYRLVGAADPVVTANPRWLAGYRHRRHGVAGLAEAWRAAFAEPVPLLVGAEAVGDPIAVLPVLFHLLWPRDQPHPPPPPSGQLHPGGQPFLIWHARWVATAGAWLIVSS
jgi:hypothetical protein